MWTQPKALHTKIPEDGFIDNSNQQSYKRSVTGYLYRLLSRLASIESPQGLRHQEDLSFYEQFVIIFNPVLKLVGNVNRDVIIVIFYRSPCAYIDALKSGAYTEPRGKVNDLDHLFAAIAPSAVCSMIFY